MSELEPMTAADERTIHDQLGRMPRGVAGVAWRCPCGKPGVVATEPRLPDGTPFPTTYYLTCPRATSGCSTLEAGGLMAEMTERLGTDEELAKAYRGAHEAYLTDRAKLGEVPEIDGITIDVPAQNKIVISGPDKQKVGQFAAEVREKRPPEPYKGKGIKYVDEVIRRKVGKTGAKK